MRIAFRVSVFFIFLVAQFSAQRLVNPETLISTIGPPSGTLILGSAETPGVFERLIEAAGGPDALIIYVPTASRLKPDGPIERVAPNPEERLKTAGAKNVILLHTFDRKVADSDSFVETIKKANGVWFGGGHPEYLLDTYAGTKAQAAFESVLSRGGVLGGASAGAMVLASDTTNSLLDEKYQLAPGKGSVFCAP